MTREFRTYDGDHKFPQVERITKLVLKHLAVGIGEFTLTAPAATIFGVVLWDEHFNVVPHRERGIEAVAKINAKRHYLCIPAVSGIQVANG